MQSCTYKYMNAASFLSPGMCNDNTNLIVAWMTTGKLHSIFYMYIFYISQFFYLAKFSKNLLQFQQHMKVKQMNIKNFLQFIQSNVTHVGCSGIDHYAVYL
jgi:hypothetical protein